MSTNSNDAPEASLGQRVQQTREAKGLSVAELAKITGVSKAYIHQIEGGDCPRPSADVLFRIATSLGTSIAYLLGREDTNKPEAEAVVIPDTLNDFAKIRPEISQDEIRDLARIRFRGKQPSSKEDWEFLWMSLKRTVQ